MNKVVSQLMKQREEIDRKIEALSRFEKLSENGRQLFSDEVHSIATHLHIEDDIGYGVAARIEVHGAIQIGGYTIYTEPITVGLNTWEGYEMYEGWEQTLREKLPAHLVEEAIEEIKDSYSYRKKYD